MKPKEDIMHYASPKHERTYRNAIKGRCYLPRTLAALFLLTADRRLWRHWRRAAAGQRIDWMIGVSRPDYGFDVDYLEKAALSFARHDLPQVSLYDLADCCTYPTELIVLVLSALLIARDERIPKFRNRRRKRSC